MAGLIKSNRRDFIANLLKAGMLAGISSLPHELLADTGTRTLTVLHTNDTHSRIDPFPDNDPKYAGLGGVSRRAEIINTIRSGTGDVLLLDSGDIFQGTPYFNLYGGEIELKAMSSMKYDAATLGNHDFDNGADGLAKQLPNASFPFINSNYIFDDTPLEGKIQKYRVFERGGLRIGVFGLGIELNGLVDPRFTSKIIYTDPIKCAAETARLLRNREDCDIIICLSHLGYRYEDRKKASDEKLAMETKDIDLILGGHTHTFLDQPVLYKNTANKKVLVAQCGWAGIRLGRIDFIFSLKDRRLHHSAHTVKISKKSS